MASNNVLGQNSQPFEFLALPPEIRNMIYQYYIPTYHVVDRGIYAHVLARSDVRPLLYVNEQISNEFTQVAKDAMVNYDPHQLYDTGRLPASIIARLEIIEFTNLDSPSIWTAKPELKLDLTCMPSLTHIVCQIPWTQAFEFEYEVDEISHDDLLAEVLPQTPDGKCKPGRTWTRGWHRAGSGDVPGRFKHIIGWVEDAAVKQKQVKFYVLGTSETFREGITRSGEPIWRHWEFAIDVMTRTALFVNETTPRYIKGRKNRLLWAPHVVDGVSPEPRPSQQARTYASWWGNGTVIDVCEVEARSWGHARRCTRPSPFA